MKIPHTGKKKALIVIDVQPAFIRPHNKHIVSNIVSLLDKQAYDLYIESLFHAEKDSLWDEQQKWVCPIGEDTHTVNEIAHVLSNLKPIKVLKETRSVFKGSPNILDELKNKEIEEIHLVGTETNDCVFATALDAFDLGYRVYIIEECCESASEGRHEPAVQLLRYQGMTNNSCLAKTVEESL